MDVIEDTFWDNNAKNCIFLDILIMCRYFFFEFV